MKRLRGTNTLILFRNGDNLEAYGADAEIIADTLKLKSYIENELVTVKLPVSEIENQHDKLVDAGLAVCISEMRDESGNFIVNIAQDEYEQDSKDN